MQLAKTPVLSIKVDDIEWAVRGYLKRLGGDDSIIFRQFDAPAIEGAFLVRERILRVRGKALADFYRAAVKLKRLDARKLPVIMAAAAAFGIALAIAGFLLPVLTDTMVLAALGLGVAYSLLFTLLNSWWEKRRLQTLEKGQLDILQRLYPDVDLDDRDSFIVLAGRDG